VKRLAPLLLLVACKPTLPPAKRAYAPPTAKELYDSLTARVAHLRTLRAEGKVEYRQQKQSAKLGIQFLAARPDKLRLEAESSLVGPVMTFATDGKSWQLLDQRHGRFTTGTAADTVGLVGIDLPPSVLIDALMGGVPLAAPPAQVSWDPTHGGREVLTLANGERIWLDARGQSWDPVRAETAAWRVEHDEFTDQGGARLPRRTVLADETHKAEAGLRLKSVEPNVTANEAAFSLQAP
jgi:outer membrane biogenesis lipoprotein LolB